MTSPVRPRRLALIAAAMAALVLCAAPFAPRSADAAVFDPKTFTLDNGLRVVLVENHRVASPASRISSSI
jgi:zinc protease